MKRVDCVTCGGNDFYEENGYWICNYCGAKYKKTAEDIAAKKSTIDLNADVIILLEKIKSDPTNAAQYAKLILEIDPNNESALQILNTHSTKGGGCYVATAVYGSYDCPEVWTLRRFRDYTLAETWYGRVFICTYYAISPTLVKWFGHAEWFKKMWKGKLDRMVANLNTAGIENTPYVDRLW